MALTNPTTELLLSLKLAGMAEAFQEQCAMPDYNQLGFEDRLALLLERERLHRSDRSYQARLRQAQLRERAEVADVFCTAGRGITKTNLLHLASGHWIHVGANLVIIGKTGVGKTYLACALANQACRQNRSVAYKRVPELVAELTQARGTGKLQRLLRRLTRLDLLVLDDWGLQTLSAEGRRDILEIVEYRNTRKSTVIASQLPVDHWHDIVGEGTIADAILDRIVHYAHHIELAGESQRKERKPPPLNTTPDAA